MKTLLCCPHHPPLGLFLLVSGGGRAALTLVALGLIPTSLNSSLWAGLLEDCRLAFSGECDWKDLVVMTDQHAEAETVVVPS